MAAAAAFSFDVENYGVSTVIPDDDIARLMYYLNCITVGIDLDILADDLVAYKHYRLLSPARIALVVQCALELSPDEVIDKLIFRDDAGDVTRNLPNKFLNISAACSVVALDESVLIAGKVRKATKVMFFKSSWLKQYYIEPMARIARVLLRTQHCSHCEGAQGICCCSTCPRTSESKCQPFLNAFLDVISMAPPAPQADLDKHQCNCDGCGLHYFTGVRYRCTVCDDYDLCSLCYQKNIHNLAHAFKRIDKPGAQPTFLAPRRKPTTPTLSTSRSVPQLKPDQHRCTCDGCYQRNFTGFRYKCTVCDDYDLCSFCYMAKKHDLDHPFMQIDKPGAQPRKLSARQPAPTFYPDCDGRDDPTSDSPFFYNSMTIAELRAYLKEHQVNFGDVFDKETLCRRAWDTYCDCMSVVELNKFLSDNNISTANCKDVNSRRQRAKDAFVSPERPPVPPASRNTSSHRFRKDDVVVFTGLTRQDMNGKKGTVVSVDHPAGKAVIRVEDMDKTFKIKFENLQKPDEEWEELE